MVKKSPNAFRTISEVSDALEVPAHVLRFWESKFNQIKPVKRGGGRRYYRPTDLDLIRGIRDLLYSEGLTIKGVQKVLREKGVRHVMDVGTLTDVREVNVKDETLWDEPDGKQLEQREDRQDEHLFEMAESRAPAPRKPVELTEKPASKPDQKSKKLEVVKAAQVEPDIRSLFDDPPPSEAAQQAIADDETIAKVAKIAEAEHKQEAQTAEAEINEEVNPGDSKKAEIKRVLGNLEQLRDRMKRV